MSDYQKTVAIVSKCSPRRAGGGLGVAYNLFRGIDSIRSAPYSIMGVWGKKSICVEEGKWSAAIKSDESSPQEPRIKTLPAQISILNSHRALLGGIIAMTPFYAWPAVPGPHAGVKRIHVEQSKGGRHHELCKEQGRFGIREFAVAMAVQLNFRMVDAVIFPSAGALELFRTRNPNWEGMVLSKAVVIPNGIDLESHPVVRKSRSEVLRIVSIADHIPEKGLQTLVEEAAKAKNAGVAFTIDQYGNPGKCTDTIQQAVSVLGLKSVIRFHGRKSHAEIITALRQADIFLHTPEVAVFDQSIIEAMLCGALVVSVNLPGIIEAVGQEYPYLTSSQVGVSDLLKTVWLDRIQSGKIAEQARSRAEQLFSAKTMAERYLKLFQDEPGSR